MHEDMGTCVYQEGVQHNRMCILGMFLGQALGREAMRKQSLTSVEDLDFEMEEDTNKHQS